MRQGWCIGDLLLYPIVLEVVGGVVSIGDVKEKDPAFGKVEKDSVLTSPHSIDIEAAFELFEIKVGKIARLDLNNGGKDAIPLFLLQFCEEFIDFVHRDVSARR